MVLKLIYITNNPDVALIAEKNGVDRIFVDMEYIDKAKRQHGRDCVLNHHTFEDEIAIREAITKSEVLVRVNPMHDEQADGYPGTEDEIERVLQAGADIVMLPYFKTVNEVDRFLEAVNGRARTMLLLETAEAAKLVDEVASLDGVD